jgi:hypothetical protein
MLRGVCLRGQSIVPGEKLAVFSCEDVVRHGCYGESCAKVFAKCEHKSCLSRANGSGMSAHIHYYLRCKLSTMLWLQTLSVQILENRHLPTDADGEGSVLPVSVLDNRHLASQKAAWPIQNLVCVAMVSSGMRMRRAIM